MGLFSKAKRLFDSPDRFIRSYSAGGKKVVCPLCGNETFEMGTALLNTPGLTFLDLDWANRTAKILICAKCSHIQWFLKEPLEL